jgi:hypothetical protein
MQYWHLIFAIKYLFKLQNVQFDEFEYIEHNEGLILKPNIHTKIKIFYALFKGSLSL